MAGVEIDRGSGKGSIMEYDRQFGITLPPVTATPSTRTLTFPTPVNDQHLTGVPFRICSWIGGSMVISASTQFISRPLSAAGNGLQQTDSPLYVSSMSIYAKTAVPTAFDGTAGALTISLGSGNSSLANILAATDISTLVNESWTTLPVNNFGVAPSGVSKFGYSLDGQVEDAGSTTPVMFLIVTDFMRCYK